MKLAGDRRREFVYGFFALVLLLAAGLKAYAFFVGKTIEDGWSNDPKLKLLSIEWEVVLGLFLLFGRSEFYRWLLVFLTFLSFAFVSGALGIKGAASCGCLGRIHVNPWWMLVFDLAALAVLLSMRPLWADVKRFRYAALLGAMAAIGLTGMALAWIGERQDPATRMRKEIGITMPREVSVGAGFPGEWRENLVEITNQGTDSVRVYGGSFGCGLDLLSDCPLTILPGTKSKLRVRFRLPNEKGDYTDNGVFFVSDLAGTTAWEVPVSVTGVTLANPK
jgi:hypothetical protein